MATIVTSIRPTVLVIGGSDSAGLAGIQADNRALNAIGVHPANIVSAVTAQNNDGVLSVNPVPAGAFADQWRAVNAFAIDVIKIGLLPTAAQIDFLLQHRRPDQRLVWDPVVKATSQGSLADESNALQKKQRELLEHCTLVTPNFGEAHSLTASDAPSEDIPQSVLASLLLSLGCESALITGGPQNDAETSQTLCRDYFATRCWFHSDVKQQGFWLSSSCINTRNTRGTGCTLASTIAGALALGYATEDAVVIGKSAVNQGLDNGFSLKGKETSTQKGSLSLGGMPRYRHSLPALYFDADAPEPHELQFPAPTLPSGNSCPLGLYPVVDRANWLERLLPQGVKTIQLRIKDLTGDALKKEISRGIALANTHDARLFINDHWQLAIELGAYGVHLGQQDLDELLQNGSTPAVEKIQQAGLRLGISTHAFYEVAHALTLKPSYIACGPVFATASKDMPWTPHGTAQLSYWNRLLSPAVPVVGIGGITRERLGSIIETGVDGIAMITAITEADNPEQTTQQFLQTIAQARLST